MPNLQVRALREDEIDRAYPLVRHSVALSLDEWRDLVRQLARDDGGVLVVSAGEGLPLGLAAYRRRSCVRCGTCLKIQFQVAFELACRPTVEEVLSRELAALATQRKCGAMLHPDGAAVLPPDLLDEEMGAIRRKESKPRKGRRET